MIFFENIIQNNEENRNNIDSLKKVGKKIGKKIYDRLSLLNKNLFAQ